MALLADLAIGAVFQVARLPVPGMWPDLAAGVALDADITFGVTCLARLQVPACLGRVIRSPAFGCVLLRSASQRIVGLDLQGSLGKAAVACRAVLLVVAAVTLLLVVLSLYRVDADEIAAMALWFVVPSEL